MTRSTRDARRTRVGDARRTRIGDAITRRIEAARSLDRPGHVLGMMVSIPFRIMGRRGKSLRTTLHGTRFGHPIHPLLVAVPIGSWTASVLFDLLDGASGADEEEPTAYARAADLAISVGCLGAVAAAVTGLLDWQNTHGRARRVGVVHAAANTSALALFLSSLGLRRRGRRSPAKGLSLLGFAALFAGGYLGGHMVYRRNVGTDHGDRRDAPCDFVPVLREADLLEDAPRRVEVDGVAVALVRHGGEIHALGARCSHFGGPLSDGWVFRDGLVCPWHGSRYCLKTGRPLDGPATAGQPCFETRVRGGMIEVRRPESEADRVPRPLHARPATGRRGDPAPEVLVRHHDLMRTLFDKIAATPPDDPHRLEVLDELAGEMDMHEKIEHEIFYPAARRATDSIPQAGAEHRQLADQLAILLTLDTSSREFDEHLAALRAAVEHHAGSEEAYMFPEVQALGEEELRVLGARLADRLEELRQSRLQNLIRLGRQVLLERGRGRLHRAMARGTP